MMQVEEILTLFDDKRTESEKFEKLYEEQKQLAAERQKGYVDLMEEHAAKERARVEGRRDFGHQANIMVKNPRGGADASSRSSGSNMQSSNRAKEGAGGKRVGGGGRVANRPPVARSRNNDSQNNSKQGLNIDTTS